MVFLKIIPHPCTVMVKSLLMKKVIQDSRTKIPSGMATHLPEDAFLRRHAQEKILSTFFKWGYKEVLTPVFEYYDVLSPGISSRLTEKSYKFVDRESGKMMLLRPDITPQIARMVAGILTDEPKPLRLCYYGNVFRYEESHAGRDREMFQVGCELVGIESPEADAEVIAVASEAIKDFGITDFKIVIGQAGFLNGIISSLNRYKEETISMEFEHSLQDAISRKDAGLIKTLLNNTGIKGKVRNNILEVPNLFGGEEILIKALNITNNELSKEAIENLRKIYSLLCLYGLKDSILIDLCDIREIDYYTGLFFEIFTPGIPYPVGAGGRYDNLIGKFGYDCPSTGFAIDIESIIKAMEKQGDFFIDNNINYLVVVKKEDEKIGIKLVRELRAKGYIVIMDTGLYDINSSISYAKKNKIEKVIILGNKKEKYASEIDIKTGNKKIMTYN
ncbi:MAG: ATP phosphoribosyltransferase regulatory subunit [Nitrospirae bacterium RIFCSPLOW2_12_42_9]|nr:MAG: ATP phosphoribosyltransferase regulatory subunit [Nitrospirae bacterium RIFCSPLOWO2_02_42_7]OGW62486.1 MAG: ATP phosphoribosyltransferase regulatory subunit [Nitrospirae bacterium RIFCSPLOW2_12_42_9]